MVRNEAPNKCCDGWSPLVQVPTVMSRPLKRPEGPETVQGERLPKGLRFRKEGKLQASSQGRKLGKLREQFVCLGFGPEGRRLSPPPPIPKKNRSLALLRENLPSHATGTSCNLASLQELGISMRASAAAPAPSTSWEVLRPVVDLQPHNSAQADALFSSKLWAITRPAVTKLAKSER